MGAVEALLPVDYLGSFDITSARATLTRGEFHFVMQCVWPLYLTEEPRAASLGSRQLARTPSENFGSSFSGSQFQLPTSNTQVSSRQFSALYSHDQVMWRRPVLPFGTDFETNVHRKSIGTSNTFDSISDVLDCLGKCKVFEFMNMKQRMRLLPQLDFLLFEQGQCVVKQGTREGKFMFIVYSGELEAFKVKKGVKIHLEVSLFYS